jgi:hypothetical protein
MLPQPRFFSGFPRKELARRISASRKDLPPSGNRRMPLAGSKKGSEKHEQLAKTPDFAWRASGAIGRRFDSADKSRRSMNSAGNTSL